MKIYYLCIMEMCITGYETMENPIHSLWKSKSSFPTSCKQGFPQFHERSQLYDISTNPNLYKVQYSNYDKMRKTLLFSSVSINLFSFLTREAQNNPKVLIFPQCLRLRNPSPYLSLIQGHLFTYLSPPFLRNRFSAR